MWLRVFRLENSRNLSSFGAGLCREHGKAYAVYMINVSRQDKDGSTQAWDIYRRYSDFHDLHITIQDRVRFTLPLNLYNAGLFLYQPWRPKGLCNLKSS